MSKNSKNILKKDRSVLTTIIGKGFGKEAQGGIQAALSELWNMSWRTGENSTKRGSFSLVPSSLAEFVVPNFTPEEIGTVHGKTVSQEMTTTVGGSYIGGAITNTNFGRSYLRYRNREIGRNFTNTYREKIYQSMNEYMQSPRRYDNTAQVMLDLGFRSPEDLTDEERRAYDNWIRGQRRAGINIDYPDVYGLSGEVIRDPNRYDSWKYFLRGRIMRIARTETAAAFNLGRLNTYIEQGYTEFIWTLGGERECGLCKDKEGDIVTLADLGVAVHSYDSIGWTDYNKVWTEAGKNDSGITNSGRSYDNNTAIFPPIHPNCFEANTPILLGNGTEIEINKIKKGDLVTVGVDSENNIIVSEVYNVVNRDYSGKLITLEYYDGKDRKTYRATEDHPVFDGERWRPIKDFRVGDTVYQYSSLEKNREISRSGNVSKNTRKNNKGNSNNDSLQQSTSNEDFIYFSRTLREQIRLLQKESVGKKSYGKSKNSREGYKNFTEQSFKTSKVPQWTKKRSSDAFSQFLGSQYSENNEPCKSRMGVRNTNVYLSHKTSIHSRLLSSKRKYLFGNKRTMDWKRQRKVFMVQDYKKLYLDRPGSLPILDKCLQGFNRVRITKVNEEQYEGKVYNFGVEETNWFVASQIASHNCDCRLVPREEGKRSGLAVIAEDVLSKAAKMATVAMKMLGKTAAITSVGVGATTLAEEYMRQGQYLEQEESGNILWTILAGTSLLAGGYMMFKLITTHPQFLQGIKDNVIKIGQKLLGKAINSTLTEVQARIQLKINQEKERYIKEQLRQEEEDLPPEERQAYIDFTNLGMAPTLAKQMVEELRVATNKGNYHDLVATKLREHLFSRLSPREINLLSDLDSMYKRDGLWELNFGNKSQEVQRLTGAILAHLEMGAETGQSVIASVTSKGEIKRFKQFMGASLQDVAEQGRHAFKGKLLNVPTIDVVDVVTDLRNELGRELVWDTDLDILKQRLQNKFNLSNNSADILIADLQTTFPNSRSGLPTGNNLVLQTEKLHPLSMPKNTSRDRILAFRERLTNIKTSKLIDNESALNNLQADVEAFKRELETWGELGNLKPMNNFLTEIDAARAIPKTKRNSPRNPLLLPEFELVPITEQQPPVTAEELGRVIPNQELWEAKQSRGIAQNTIDTAYQSVSIRQFDMAGDVKRKIGYSRGTSFKIINEGADVNRKRTSELVNSNNKVNNIERQLDDITRDWSDPNYISDQPYIESARSSKRSSSTNRKLISLHGELEQERKNIVKLQNQREDAKRKLEKQKQFLERKIKEAKERQLKGDFDNIRVEGILDDYKQVQKSLNNYKNSLVNTKYEKYLPQVNDAIKTVQDKIDNLNSLSASGVVLELEQDIIDINNLLRFYNQPNDHGQVLEQIDNLMNGKLSVVKSIRGGKKVIGSNTWFPEKLDGVELFATREKRRVFQQQESLRKTFERTRKNQQRQASTTAKKIQRIANDTESALTKHRKFIETEDRNVSQYNYRLLNEFEQKERVSQRLLIDLEEISNQAKQAKAVGNEELLASLEQKFEKISGTAKANNAVMDTRKNLRSEIRRLEKLRDHHKEFKREAESSKHDAIQRINQDINKQRLSIARSRTIGDAEKERLGNVLKRAQADSEYQINESYERLMTSQSKIETELNELINSLKKEHEDLRKGKLRVMRNEKANIGDKVEMTGEKDLSGRIRKLKRVFQRSDKK